MATGSRVWSGSTGAVVVGTAVLLVGLAAALSHREHRLLLSNRSAAKGFVKVVKPNRELCQPEPELPDGTGSVHMVTDTYGLPGPPLRVVLRGPGRVVARGDLARGWHQGDVVVPIRAERPPSHPARICLQNGGPARVALGGSMGRFRVDYLTKARRSWWGWAGLMQDRFSQGKSSWYGSWALPVALALIALAAVLALVTTVRRVR